MWSASEHEVIVKSVSKNSGISQANINYMAKTSKLADRTKKYKDTDVFHGKSNYVMSLKFLWKYANLIGKGNTAASAAKTVKARY